METKQIKKGQYLFNTPNPRPPHPSARFSEQKVAAMATTAPFTSGGTEAAWPLTASS
jgi:hypothetical protein